MYHLHPHELELIRSDEQTASEIISNPSNAAAREAVATMYMHICKGNIKHSEFFIRTVYQKFMDRDQKDSDNWFVAINQFLGIQDDLTERRTEVLLRTMSEECKLHKDTDLRLTDEVCVFFLEMAQKYHYVNDYFINSKDSWKWIIDWYKDEINREKNFMRDPKVKPHPQKIQHNQEKIKVLQKKLSKFKRLYRNEMEPFRVRRDSSEYRQPSYDIGDKVEVYDNKMKRWVVGVVENTFYDMLLINVEMPDSRQYGMWIENDPESITPYRSSPRSSSEETLDSPQVNSNTNTDMETQANHSENEDRMMISSQKIGEIYFSIQLLL
eukprot:TRINITY_DN5499_c0_g1_i2.p1 TRINITY_DN5499_c0_g1~~TRINITY_DN5499_c0_g1_i2.p1  ORF type:complete len:325 (-),score=39.77 TRINITY_DN5499_c0_g1_i2:338-1312(-)